MKTLARNDLAADMGYRGQARHPQVLGAITEAVAVARAAGKAVGILYADGDLAAFLEMGITLTAVGSDMQLPVRGADALAQRFKRDNAG